MAVLFLGRDFFFFFTKVPFPMYMYHADTYHIHGCTTCHSRLAVPCMCVILLINKYDIVNILATVNAYIIEVADRQISFIFYRHKCA